MLESEPAPSAVAPTGLPHAARGVSGSGLLEGGTRSTSKTSGAGAHGGSQHNGGVAAGGIEGPKGPLAPGPPGIGNRTIGCRGRERSARSACNLSAPGCLKRVSIGRTRPVHLAATHVPGTPVPAARPATRRTSSRLGAGTLTVLAALAGLAMIVATNQVLPATSPHQAELRTWLAARAAGITALILLAFQVAIGLVLSHPTNKSTWKLSKRLFPWHEHAWVFTLAFVAVHVVALAADRFANVGWLGAFVPGLSEYRTVPVALGSLALYALLVTGLTARVTKLLPSGWWLKLHRLSLAVLILGWSHGVLAGTDSADLRPLYQVTFAMVAAAAAYRYWVSRAARPTFASSLPGESSR